MAQTKATLSYGTKTCRCSVCGEYFTTVNNFDRHRKGKPGQKVCVDPATTGLVITQRGESTLWAMPSRFIHE